MLEETLERCKMKIVVKIISKSTPVEKWVNCELKITIFHWKKSLDTVANVIKNDFVKFKSNPVTHLLS